MPWCWWRATARCCCTRRSAGPTRSAACRWRATASMPDRLVHQARHDGGGVAPVRGKPAARDGAGGQLPAGAGQPARGAARRHRQLLTAEPVPAARQPTVHDLMTHRAGFTYFFFPKNALRDRYRELGIDRIDTDAAPEMLRKLATLPLAFDPGTSFEYSIATDLLGHIVERVTGKPLDQALNELVLEPLKMRDTMFHVSGPSAGAAGAARRQRPRHVGVRLARRYQGAEALLRRRRPGLHRRATTPGCCRWCSTKASSTACGCCRQRPCAGRCRTRSARRAASRTRATATRGICSTRCAPRRAVRSFPGSVGDIFWGGITGPRYFMDPEQRLVGVLLLLRPSERAAVHCGVPGPGVRRASSCERVRLGPQSKPRTGSSAARCNQFSGDHAAVPSTTCSV